MQTPTIKSSPQKTSSSTLKFLGYSLVITLFLLVTAFLLSPQLISTLINWQLGAYQLHSDAEIERPSGNHLLIPSITIAHIDPENTAKLSLQNLRINYNLVDLVFSQRIQSIQVDVLKIQLAGAVPIPYQSDEDANNTPLDLSEFLPNKMLEALPFESLTIDNLTLDWHRADQQRLTLDAKLGIDKHALTLTANYRENQQFITNFELQLSANNKFTILTTTAESDNHSLSLQLQGSIHPDNGQNQTGLSINTHTQINTSHYLANSLWLEPLLGSEFTKLFSFINGELSINKHLRAPAQFSNLKDWITASSAQSDFSFDLTHSNPKLLLAKSTASLNNTGINSLQIKGSGNSHYQRQLFKLNLDPTSSIAINGLQLPTLQADKLSLSLSSALSTTFVIDDSPLIEALKIADFSAIFVSDKIHTDFGSISHLPLELALTAVDLANTQLSINYHLAELQLSPDKNNSALPFNRIKSELKGSVKIGKNQIQASINPKSEFEIIDLATDALSTDHLKITNNQAIYAAFNLTTKKSVITDHALTIASTTWQSTFGKFTHSDIDLKIADLDIENQRINVQFNPFSASLQAKKLPVKSIEITASGNAQANNGELSLTLNKGLLLQLKKLNTAGIRASTLKLRTTTDSQLKASLISFASNPLRSITLSPLSAVITGSSIRYATQKINYQSLSVKVHSSSLSPLRIRADSNIKQVSLSHHPALKKLNISASHKIDNKRHRLNVKLTSQHLPIAITAQVDSRNQYRNITGNWKLSPINLAEHGLTIAKTLQLALPEALNISTGLYQQQGKFSLKNNRLKGSATHQLSDLALDIKTLAIAGINSVSESSYSSEGSSQLSHSGNITISTINHAIPMSDFSATFKLRNLLKDSATLSINNTKAIILEANLSVDNFKIPLKHPRGASVLHFSNLPLNNLLALEQQPSLTGTGTLAGKLPFNFIDKQLWIKNGEIHSTDNGYIRYHANDQVRAFANTNAGLDIALNVLEDFHYKVLSINANYTPNGDLILHNKLSGKNPNWQNGQPIEFAINIEENVLQLLKALQFSDQLAEQIQKKVEKSQK